MSLSKPTIVTIDMGWKRAPVFAVHYPYPVYRGADGTYWYIHPKQRFKSRLAAEKFLSTITMQCRCTSLDSGGECTYCQAYYCFQAKPLPPMQQQED